MVNNRIQKFSQGKSLNYIRTLSFATERVVSSKHFTVAIFGWFILQAIYMAFSIQEGIPPDENYHYLFIKFFSSNGWLPFLGDQTGYFTLGEATKTPFFLYHYLLSLPVHVFGIGEHTFYMLRILNVLLGVGSLYLVYKLANRIGVSALVRNLSLFMLANTLMFIFLSSSINYDNFFVFLSLASMLLLTDIAQKPRLLQIELLAICLVAGMLTKISFLPIAFTILLILIIQISKNKMEYSAVFRSYKRKSKTWALLLFVILALIFSLFLQHYATNLVRYRTFLPKCTQVLTLEQCRHNPVFSRDERLSNMQRPQAVKQIPEYSTDWALLMQERIFGVFAHKSFAPHPIVVFGLTMILILGAIAFIRIFKTNDGLINILLVVAGSYTIVLLLENFARYHKFGSFTFAVQGRYLFAVLPVIYIMVNKYIVEFLQRKSFRLAYIVVVILVFLASSLPSYIVFTDSSWNNKTISTINHDIRSVFIR